MAFFGGKTHHSLHGKDEGRLKIMDFKDEMEIFKRNMLLAQERHHQPTPFVYPKQRSNAIVKLANIAHAATARCLEATNDIKKIQAPQPAHSASQKKFSVMRKGTPTKQREAGGQAPQRNKGATVKPVKRNATQKPGTSQKAGQRTRKTLSPPSRSVVSQLFGSALSPGVVRIASEDVLTKPEANALETSMYAAKYLAQHKASKALRPSTNYPTASLLDTGVKVAKQTILDDPCDNPNAFVGSTDDDVDEDKYEGQPFYLEGEEQEMHQSRAVHDTRTEEGEMYFTPMCVLSLSLFPNVPPYLNFASHAQHGPPMPDALQKVLKWKLSPIMPQIVKRVVLNSGFRIIKHTYDWTAVWEKHMRSPGFRTIRSQQKYNHMPGSFRIGRKDTIWRSIEKNMRKFGRKEFGFMQQSYIMPEDVESLRKAWPRSAAKQTKWIVKPPASARGSGIRIVTKWSQFSKDRPLVVQRYIEHPLLVNDSKFDMRLYVMITSIDPLRIYMYKDGLARFAAIKYSPGVKSLDDRCMHLTNYSINKYSQSYSKNEDFNSCQGHKWTLQALWCCLEERGVNTKRLWATLRNLVIKAILSGEGGLTRMYRQFVNFRYNCFELFGFDVLLDNEIVPWLLEVNVSPSLHSDLPVDLHIKGPLIQAVFNTALYQVPPRLSKQQQADVIRELKLDVEPGQLCLNKHLFTTCLKPLENRKHGMFIRTSIATRMDYLDCILENLTPDDIRCLVITEDELHRCAPLERIFPTPDTYQYLKFMEDARYYNRLLDAWEHKYGHRRAEGIEMLTQFCQMKYHLEVSAEATEKEPKDQMTEIDLLRMPKTDDHEPGRLRLPKSTTGNAALPKSTTVTNSVL